MNKKEEKLLKLIQALNASDGPKNACIASWKLMANNSGVELPQESLEELWESMDIATLMELYVPIYSKYIDEAQLSVILEYTEKPEIQKFQKDMANIVEESSEITTIWFNNRRAKITAKLEELFGKDEEGI